MIPYVPPTTSVSTFVWCACYHPVRSCPRGDSEGRLGGGPTPLGDKCLHAAAGSLGWCLAIAAEPHPQAISTVVVFKVDRRVLSRRPAQGNDGAYVRCMYAAP